MNDDRRTGSDRTTGRAEVGRLASGDVFVKTRDDSPGGPVLTFTQQEWAAFVAGVKNGEFDLERAAPVAGGKSPDR